MSNIDLFGTEKINTSKSLLKNQAYELIKAAIIENRLNPENIYSQDFLSKNLGISRTPVREALLQLRGEGLIHIHRGRGIQVIPTTIHDLNDMLEMREAIECKICQLAIGKIDQETLYLLENNCLEQKENITQNKINDFTERDHDFHCILAKASNNKRLYEMVEQTNEQIMRSGVLLKYKQQDLRNIVSEHKRIIDALFTHCEKTAIEAMQLHFTGIFSRIAKCMEQLKNKTGD